MRKHVGIWLVLALGAFSVWALPYYWVSGVLDGDFTDASNWTSNVCPGTADTANMSEGSAIISDGMDIAVNYLNIARTNTFSVVQTGGTVTVLSTGGSGDPGLKIGRGEDASSTGVEGTYTLTGGSVYVPDSRVAVGNFGTGTLNVSGTGKLVTRFRVVIARQSLPTCIGTVNLTDGGTITAAALELVTTNASLTFDGGIFCATNTTDNGHANPEFLSGASGTYATVGDGGVVFDTAGFDCMSSIPLKAPENGVQGGVSPAGVEKIGAGTLRLTVTNTYDGPTVVSAGTLVAMHPGTIPGYDEPGRLTVKAGANLQFGSGWTEEEKAVALANMTLEEGAGIGAAFDVTGTDVTIADDLTYTGGMDKLGNKMLTLTGHNTFGGEQKISAGTLRADFGEGLDANYCVTLAGGTLSSVSGNITTTIGSGPGQVRTLSGFKPAFTARGVPLTVNLLNGAGASNSGIRLDVTNAFPSGTLTLNGTQADQPITFENNINVLGTTTDNPFSLYVYSGTATLSGSIMDSGYNADNKDKFPTTFSKYGAGTLRLTNSGFRDRCFRFNVEEGNVVFDHPASVANAANGSGLFWFLNKRGSGTLYATNQSITCDNNFNHYEGHTRFKGGKLTVNKGSGTNTGNINIKNGDALFDGVAISVTQSVIAGDDANMSGVGVFTNGVTLTAGSEFAAGSNNKNVFGRLEVHDSCSVTGQIVGAGSGEIVQYGGSLYAKGSSMAVRIGRHTGRRGFYYMKDGEFGSKSTINLGRSAGSYGLLWQTGGTVCPSSSIVIGDIAGSTGVVHVLGGEMLHETNFIRAGKDGDGELVVRGEGVVRTVSPLSLANTSSTGSGRVMLCKGGVIEAPQVLGHGTTANGRYAEFVFDGGTLRASADSATYVNNLTAFEVGTGGGAVDTDGHDITFAQPLTATVLHSDLAHRWSFNGDFIDSVTGESPVDTNGWSFITRGSGKAVKLTGGAKGTSHISLGPNKLPVDGSEATIELWARVDKHNNWQRAFDIGKDGTHYIALTWRREGSNTDRCAINYNGTRTGVDDALQPYNINDLPWNHICVVCKQNGDGTWTIRAYRKYQPKSGEPWVEKRGEFTAPKGWSLANQDQTYTYIGRSLQDNNDASASYDEFRIWKRALTDEEIAENDALGPDALPTPVFEKRGAGCLTLTGANTYAADTRVAGGTLALGASSSLPSATSVELGDGAALALGGNSQTVASLTGTGAVTGGVLTVTGNITPGTSTNETATLTFADASVAGTLELDATEDAIDSIASASGVFDLSGLTLQINNIGALTGASYTLATSADGFTGTFAGANVAGTPWRISYGRNAVKLSRGGTVFMIR